MIFWKKRLSSEEYEALHKRVLDLQGANENLAHQLSLIKSDLSNLRGQFNRKLSGIAKEEEKVGPKEEEKPKALNTKEPKVFRGLTYGDIPE